MPHRRAISTRPRPTLVPRGIAIPGVLAVAARATLTAAGRSAAVATLTAGGRTA